MQRLADASDVHVGLPRSLLLGPLQGQTTPAIHRKGIRRFSNRQSGVSPGPGADQGALGCDRVWGVVVVNGCSGFRDTGRPNSPQSPQLAPGGFYGKGGWLRAKRGAWTLFQLEDTRKLGSRGGGRAVEPALLAERSHGWRERGQHRANGGQDGRCERPDDTAWPPPSPRDGEPALRPGPAACRASRAGAGAASSRATCCSVPSPGRRETTRPAFRRSRTRRASSCHTR